MPKVSLSLLDEPNAETVEVAEEDAAEVRMRCAVDANPAAHAVEWLKDVSRSAIDMCTCTFLGGWILFSCVHHVVLLVYTYGNLVIRWMRRI